jgi:crotonobetainyl-CoA:carnitine CoA-transferase CaiB-like acyl-CoA transferase
LQQTFLMSGNGGQGIVVASKLFAIAVVATSNSAFVTLGNVIGHPEWASVQRYFTQQGRSEDRQRIRKAIIEWLAGLPSVRDAEQILSAAGIVTAVVRDARDVLGEPVLAEHGMVVNTRDGAGGTFPTINTPFHFEAHAAGLDGQRCAGAVGRDSVAFLRECGLSEQSIEQLREARAIDSAPEATESVAL